MSKPKSKTINRLTPMLKLDFYRLFKSPLFYVMVGIAALIPALVLGMTAIPDPETGEIIATFKNTWQLISFKGGQGISGMGDFATIDMLFIFAGLMMAIFVARDYSSGFVRNIFTVHSKKQDYAISKTAVGVFSGICMIISYFIATVVMGAIMGKSFDVNVSGLIFCLLSKAVMMLIFCSLFLAVAIFFKEKLWLTIIATFLVGMMLYPAAIFAANLDATFITFIMSIVGSLLFGFAFYCVSNLFLKRRDLV